MNTTPLQILFLDVDGVLNSTEWYRCRPSTDEWAATMNISPEMYRHDRIEWAMRSIDPAAVRALNAIVTRSSARVVVSSTWRTMYSLSQLERMLRYLGFEHHLIGATPESSTVRTRGHEGRIYRGDEITAWLRTMFHDSGEFAVSVVILDDDSDMGDLSPRLYQTSHDVGLRATDVDAVVDLLEHPTAVARRLPHQDQQQQ